MSRQVEKSTGISVRSIGLDALIAVLEREKFCDKVVQEAVEKYPLEARDRAFFVRLVEGTVEHCIQLDYILNCFSKTKVKKMKPVIRNILRMGVYQILFMDQVPDSAACNEAVQIVKKRKFYNLSGFVNGVLRNVVRQKDSIVYPDRMLEFEKYLEVCYSMPEWIVSKCIEDYGKQAAEEMFASFLGQAGKTSVRCLHKKYSVEEIWDSLIRDGVQVKQGKFFDYALEISGYGSLKQLPAFQSGRIQVQDESSMLVAEVAGIKEGNIILDVCAAPGGKSMHCAELLEGTGRVYAADVATAKLALIEDNKRRLGYQNIDICQNDALQYREEWKEIADIVIADLPCSGLGVIGKKCDIKYKTKPGDISSLASLQKEILQVVWQYVKPGGRLVFSTCTIAPEENIQNVKWISENLPFIAVSIEDSLPNCLKGRTGMEGYIQVLPQDAQTDGFFVSCFQRL